MNTDERRWSRRDVICSSLAMAGLPPLCCSVEDIPAASVTFTDDGVAIELKQAPGLLRKGGSGKIVDEGRSVNLIVAHVEKSRFVAVSRRCTHGGGLNAYNPGRRTVQCTCWGHSEFALDGRVLAGPARRPLPVYEVRVAGRRLEILLKRQA